MTQLAASVDANDELWTLDALPTTPFVQVQSELVEVRAMFPEHVYLPTNETIPPKIRVRRAQGGTSAASHANGTALTAVYSESAGGGVGGAEQIVTLLGPFTVSWNTPGSDVGLEVADLEAGTLIVGFLALVTTPWDSDNNVVVAVGVGQDTDDFTARSGFIDIGNAPFGVPGALANVLTVGNGPDRILCTAASKLIVQISLGGASEPTEGAVDVYVLVAEPAA